MVNTLALDLGSNKIIRIITVKHCNGLHCNVKIENGLQYAQRPPTTPLGNANPGEVIPGVKKCLTNALDAKGPIKWDCMMSRTQ